MALVARGELIPCGRSIPVGCRGLGSKGLGFRGLVSKGLGFRGLVCKGLGFGGLGFKGLGFRVYIGV